MLRSIRFARGVRASVKNRYARQVSNRNYANRSAFFPYSQKLKIFGDPVKTLAEFAFGRYFSSAKYKILRQGLTV